MVSPMKVLAKLCDDNFFSSRLASTRLERTDIKINEEFAGNWKIKN